MNAKEWDWIKRLEIATKRDAKKLTDFEKKFCADFFPQANALGQRMKVTAKH